MIENPFGEKGSEAFFWGLTLPNGLRPAQSFDLTTIPGIICPDHVAFIASQDDLAWCIKFWMNRGFPVLNKYETLQTPAAHFILSTNEEVKDCKGSVVITVATKVDDSLPNRLIRHYGRTCLFEGEEIPGIPQHYALELAGDVPLGEVASNMRGVAPLFPALIETDSVTGAVLEQSFLAPVRDPSPIHLIEVIRRKPGNDGQCMQFNALQIENIYKQFDDHARSLGI